MNTKTKRSSRIFVTSSGRSTCLQQRQLCYLYLQNPNGFLLAPSPSLFIFSCSSFLHVPNLTYWLPSPSHHHMNLIRKSRDLFQPIFVSLDQINLSFQAVGIISQTAQTLGMMSAFIGYSFMGPLSYIMLTVSLPIKPCFWLQLSIFPFFAQRNHLLMHTEKLCCCVCSVLNLTTGVSSDLRMIDSFFHSLYLVLYLGIPVNICLCYLRIPWFSHFHRATADALRKTISTHDGCYFYSINNVISASLPKILAVLLKFDIAESWSLMTSVSSIAVEKCAGLRNHLFTMLGASILVGQNNVSRITRGMLENDQFVQ